MPLGFSTDEEIDGWKNFNSFVPRLTHEVRLRAAAFPYWQLRDTLEAPLSENETAAGKFAHIWVASSWLIEQGDRLFAQVTSSEGVEDEGVKDEKGTLRTGPLCLAKKPWCRERWAFWKKQLPEVLDDVCEESGKVTY